MLRMEAMLHCLPDLIQTPAETRLTLQGHAFCFRSTPRGSNGETLRARTSHKTAKGGEDSELQDPKPYCMHADDRDRKSADS